MKSSRNVKVLFVLAALGLYFSSMAQSTKSDEPPVNQAKVKIQAKPDFKDPFVVELMASNEKDQGNHTIVYGLTVKGNISSLSPSEKKLAGGGAAAASYAATGRMAAGNIKVTIIQRETGDEATTMTDANGYFLLTLKHDTLHTILINGTEYGEVKLKTKHDTAKNSIGNIR